MGEQCQPARFQIRPAETMFYEPVFCLLVVVVIAMQDTCLIRNPDPVTLVLITTVPKKWIQMSTLTFLISAGAVFENGIGAPTAGLISRFKTVLAPISGTLNVI